MKNLILFFLVALTAVSCTHFRNSNFNHQKFTNLKPLESSKEVNTSDISENKKEIPSEFTYENYDTEDSTGCDSIWLSNGEIYVCTITNETKEYVSFSRCPPDSSEFRISQLLVLNTKRNETENENTAEINNTIKDESNLEKVRLSEDNNQATSVNSDSAKNNKSIAAKHWIKLFFVALGIFLVGGIFLIISIFTGFPFILCILFLIVAWILSIILSIQSSRKEIAFDKKEVGGFGIKRFLSVLYAFAPLIALAITVVIVFLVILSFFL